MLKVYVFWGIFTVVLIGVAVTLIQRHRRSQKGRAASGATAAESAAIVAPGDRPAASPPASPAASAAASPAASPPAAAFDPTATRIHFRPSPAGTHSALLERDEAVLPAAGSPRLFCVGGTQKGHSFSVTAAGITVGRDPQNDIVISDIRVSHRHAWVGIIDHKAVLRDLGSTNGTFLNAQMDSLVSEAVLSPGDTILFGGHGGQQFRFVVD